MELDSRVAVEPQRILGVKVRVEIFDLTPKVHLIYFSMCFVCLFYLLHT